jgi:hypothetical protein
MCRFGLGSAVILGILTHDGWKKLPPFLRAKCLSGTLNPDPLVWRSFVERFGTQTASQFQILGLALAIFR